MFQLSALIGQLIIKDQALIRSEWEWCAFDQYPLFPTWKNPKIEALASVFLDKKILLVYLYSKFKTSILQWLVKTTSLFHRNYNIYKILSPNFAIRTNFFFKKRFKNIIKFFFYPFPMFTCINTSADGSY